MRNQIKHLLLGLCALIAVPCLSSAQNATLKTTTTLSKLSMAQSEMKLAGRISSGQDDVGARIGARVLENHLNRVQDLLARAADSVLQIDTRIDVDAGALIDDAMARVDQLVNLAIRMGVENGLFDAWRDLFDGQRDDDQDGLRNSRDPDMDGDGIPNDEDDDMDGDGVPNDEDSRPRNSDKQIMPGRGDLPLPFGLEALRRLTTLGSVQTTVELVNVR